MLENSYTADSSHFTHPHTFESYSNVVIGPHVQVKLEQGAKGLKYETKGAVGADLSCLDEVVLHPYVPTLVDTGVSIALPEGTAGLVYIRSSVALRGLCLCNGVGVIDTDYRGTIKLALMNTTDIPMPIAKHTRLGQLVITPVMTPKFVEMTELNTTSRQAGGFGSTGAL